MFRVSSSDFLTKILCTFISYIRATWAVYLIIFDFNNISWKVQIMELVSMKFSPSSCSFIPFRSKYPSQNPVMTTSSITVMNCLVKIIFKNKQLMQKKVLVVNKQSHVRTFNLNTAYTVKFCPETRCVMRRV